MTKFATSKRKCLNCAEYKENISQIHQVFNHADFAMGKFNDKRMPLFGGIEDLRDDEGYIYRPMKYCAWCGSVLQTANMKS